MQDKFIENKFTTIIFDLGGVIEKIDPTKVAQSFAKSGMSNAADLFSLLKQSSICSAFELGHISEKDFIQHLQTMCYPKTSDFFIEKAWCANQLGVSKNTMQTLDQLKNNGFKLFILSNTNPIHANKIEKSFYQTYQRNFKSLFDAVYYSFILHRRKPDSKTYQYVLNDAQLSAENCIYIDDLEKNLEPAKKLGVHCIHHQTNEEINTIPLLRCFL